MVFHENDQMCSLLWCTQTGSDLGLGVGGQDLGTALHRGVVGDGLLELLPRGVKAVRKVCDLS